jgi:UDP-2,3-diacylglucosamine pyrophosphatase LpxH
MIIITDAHVSKANGNHVTFFEMLASFNGGQEDIVFLGDIFDLWMALPRYQNDIHHKFVAWCREQKRQRTIGFLEGNHEFYLASGQSQAFSWCSADVWYQDDTGSLFVHGDQVNRRDRSYLVFRKLIRNRLTRRILCYLPGGPGLAETAKRMLKQTNHRFKMHFPRAEIEAFAESRFAEGADPIFMGHFHREYVYHNPDSKALYILPDWYSTQKVTVFDHQAKKAVFLHWKQISGR